MPSSLWRRERIVGDLRLGRGERREERRLAGVREAHEPHVADEAKLEPQRALLAGLALLGVLRGLVGRGLEVGVAKTATAAPGDQRPLAGRDEVGDELARRVVDD